MKKILIVSICLIFSLICFSYAVKADEGGPHNTIVSAGKIAASIGVGLVLIFLLNYQSFMPMNMDMRGEVFLVEDGVAVKVRRPASTDQFAFCMPFVGFHRGGNGSSLHLAAGPCAGLASNYAFMVAVNAAYAKKRQNLSVKEALKRGMVSPFNAYKDLANEFTQIIVERDRYKLKSFSHSALMTFNILKSSKMVGEFLYGLTPFSIPDGDGNRLWKNFGLTKDLTVRSVTGFTLGILPACIAIMYGVGKGIYLNNKIKPFQMSE